MFVRRQTAAFLSCALILLVLAGQASVVARVKAASRRDAEKVQSASSPLTLRVTPRLAWIGSAVQALVRVSPDERNRLLRITVDAPDYYRSSDVTLDGAEARRSHLIQLTSLPAGSYFIRAVIYGVGGERGSVEQKFDVIPAQDDDRQSTTLRSPRNSVPQR